MEQADETPKRVVPPERGATPADDHRGFQEATRAGEEAAVNQRKHEEKLVGSPVTHQEVETIGL